MIDAALGVHAVQPIVADTPVCLIDLDDYPNDVPLDAWYEQECKDRSGRCYELAYLAIANIKDPGNAVHLVHGWQRCTDTTGAGRTQMGHAWLQFSHDNPERDLRDKVWEPITMTLHDVDAWYQQAGSVRVYSATEARTAMVRSRHLGPWHLRPFGIEGDGTT